MEIVAYLCPKTLQAMLSICIPVYNYDVTHLVHSIHHQIAKQENTAEILVLDDGSGSEWKRANRTIADLPGVRYEELPGNVGRSRIRNILFEKASYRYLLILDCDTAVTDDRYVRRYMEAAQEGVVVCGGRTYGDRPADTRYLLHWFVGSRREVTTAGQRKKKPHHRFITGNFMIDRNVFEAIRFHEGISGYGHEDTLFGYELMKRGIPVHHIDNPLMHAGIDETPLFLEKTLEGVRNLVRSFELVNRDPDYAGMVRMLRVFQTLKKYRLCKWVALFSKKTASRLERRLTGKKPRLWMYDLYKIGYLCRIDH